MNQREPFPNSKLEENLMRSARSAYPNECAGIVVRGTDGRLRTIPCPDTHTDNLHFELPARLFWSTRQHHQHIVAFYHSHPDGTGCLSVDDQRTMFVGKEPAWPGVDWYVIALDRTRVEIPIRYTWSNQHKRFQQAGVDSCI